MCCYKQIYIVPLVSQADVRGLLFLFLFLFFSNIIERGPMCKSRYLSSGTSMSLGCTQTVTIKFRSFVQGQSEVHFDIIL